MLNRLRNVLKKWLDGNEPAPRIEQLDCTIGGKTKRMDVLRAVGLRLEVSDGSGTYLVSHSQVHPRHLFWDAWSQRTTNRPAWPDGTEFDPRRDGYV